MAGGSRSERTAIEAPVSTTARANTANWKGPSSRLEGSYPESAARLFESSYGASIDLAAIRVPSLVIRGSHDALVPEEASVLMADNLSDSELHVVDGAGHVPTATRPHEVVAIIEDWITRRLH